MGWLNNFFAPAYSSNPKPFQHTDANTEGHECNDRTDFPAAQPKPRRCVGTCTPDRQTMTGARDVVKAASDATNLVLSIIDAQQLARPYNEDEAAEWSIQRRMAEADRMPPPAVYYGLQGAASDTNQQQLLNACTPEEQAIYRTYQEARLAGMSDRDALAGMGLQRGEGNRVERQLQPVGRKVMR